MAIGVNSRVGQLKSSLRMMEEKTPLQIRLDFLAEQIGKVGMAGASLAFLGCFLNLCLRCAFGSETFLSMETVASI